MALIVCNNCGKKISDTTKQCIHCGAKTFLDIENQGAENEQNKAKKKLTEYYSLSYEEQQKLETEYLEIDKEAAAWFKFGETRDMCTKFAGRILTVLIVLGMLIGFVSQGLSTLFDPNDTAIMCLTIGLCGFLLVSGICFLTIIVGLAIKVVFFRQRKQFIYFRRFDLWLREKNIIFDIVFITDSQKNLYENLDIKTEKLWR